MAVRSYRPGQIHQMHHFSTQNISVDIGIIGQNQFSQRGMGVGYCLSNCLGLFIIHVAFPFCYACGIVQLVIQTVQNPATLEAMVILIVVLFAVQTLVFFFFLEYLNRRVRKADQSLSKFSKKAIQSVRLTREYLQKLSWINEKLPVVEQEVNTLLDSLSDSARHANEVTGKSIGLTATHLEETSRRIEVALSQFSRQTNKVRRWIRYPGYYVSALIHGAFTGFRSYSRGSHSQQPATHYPDDEEFI